MARAYSLDLRERVVAAVAAGQSCRAVAATFKVSVASVVKWSQRFRATGSAAAHKVGGRRPYALADEREWLLARLAEKPDLTLRAIGAELAARGIKVSHFAVWHFFVHEGITFKKTISDGVAPVGVETLELYPAQGRERPSAFWWRVTP